MAVLCISLVQTCTLSITSGAVEQAQPLSSGIESGVFTQVPVLHTGLCLPALRLRGGVGAQELRSRAAALRKRTQAAAVSRGIAPLQTSVAVRENPPPDSASQKDEERPEQGNTTQDHNDGPIRDGRECEEGGRQVDQVEGGEWDASGWIESEMEDGNGSEGGEDERIEVEEMEGGQLKFVVFGGELEVPASEIDHPLEGSTPSLHAAALLDGPLLTMCVKGFECSILFLAAGELPLPPSFSFTRKQRKHTLACVPTNSL
eukprot:3675717-Rhodomonas_salina.1